MTRFLAAALLALSMSTAFAGDNSYTGKIVVGPEWTILENDDPLPLGAQYTLPIVRFKTKSDLGKRILRKCPDGSECYISLAIGGEYPKDYRVDGRFITVIKWPGKVLRETP